MRIVIFHNTTLLDSDHLLSLFLRHTIPYRHDRLTVRVRYSRGADFSGSCFYRDGRIFINLGRHNTYPYRLYAHLAKACSNRWYWWRSAYYLTLSDAYELVLFIYLHELYHYLVKQAGLSPRRKEAMCDRFAARVLVDQYGCPVTDSRGKSVPRQSWDFQDLDGMVSAAPRTGQMLLIPDASAARTARQRGRSGAG